MRLACPTISSHRLRTEELLMRKVLATMAILSLGASPVLAAPQPPTASAASSARSLSVAATRVGTPAKRGSNLASGASVVPLIIGAGILVGTVFLIVDNENDGDDGDSN
jgi:hypothetical protein